MPSVDERRANGQARSRRSPTLEAEWQALDAAMLDILNRERRLSVRGVLYRLTNLARYAHLTLHRGEPLNKTDSERDVQERIAKLRDCDVIDFEQIIDGTRGVTEQISWAGPGDALQWLVDNYERSVWADQAHQVYQLTEKEALTEIIQEVTDEFQVPLLTCKGHNSDSSFYHDIVKRVVAEQRPAVILMFTDLDKPGMEMCAKTEAFIRRRVGKLCRKWGLPVPPMTFERIGLTPEQARRYRLRTRPPKPVHDKPDSPNYVAKVVEVDGLEDDQIQEIVRDAIQAHLDEDAYRRTRRRERADRMRLRRIAEQFADKGKGST